MTYGKSKTFREINAGKPNKVSGILGPNLNNRAVRKSLARVNPAKRGPAFERFMKAPKQRTGK